MKFKQKPPVVQTAINNALSAGGGTGGATIGTNYIEFANGVRLYVSNTEPTGNIPNGSIGIGFTV